MTNGQSLSTPTYNEAKNIYKLPSYQIDNLLSRLSEVDIKNIFYSLNEGEKTLIYFRISLENKTKFIRAFPKLKTYIYLLENKNSYLSKIENLLVFNSKLTFSQLMRIIDVSKTKEYVREYIALEDNESKFLGVIYATDIVTNYYLKNKSYIHVCMNYIRYVIINKKYKHGDKKLEENCLIDYHRIVVLDGEKRVLGAINIDRILRTHDLYLNNEEEYMYAVLKKDLQHVAIIVCASMTGTLFSCIIVKLLNISNTVMLLMTIIRCINDIITLLIIEDKINEDIFQKYYKIVIFLISIIIAIFMIILSLDKRLFLISIVSTTLICTSTVVIARYVYENFETYGIIPMLVLPELITPFSIFLLSKII